MLPREILLRTDPPAEPKTFEYNLISAARLRGVWLDGCTAQLRAPGERDRVTTVSSASAPGCAPPTGYWLSTAARVRRWRRTTTASSTARGSTATCAGPRKGTWAAYRPPWSSRPCRSSRTGLRTDLNRAYLKLGGGGLELEAGRDESWLGLGYRGAITQTSNAKNFALVKLSSPEPLDVAWVKQYLGEVKYSLAASRFDKVTTLAGERQPWFYALKLSVKPISDLEIGFNLGRQVGGPGVNNSFGDTVRALIGGTAHDNSNGLAGFEVRYRIPWLRNTEIYGEFSGEDTALFWPIVESYVAGFYIPRLTDDGRNDLRFEFFQGNQILYTSGTFQEGYIYKGMPVGHSQGGATQDFFLRGSHWFDVRNNLALEYIYTNRGMIGRMPGQAIERKHAGRAFWSLPLNETIDARIGYGIERVSNENLVGAWTAPTSW